MIRIKEAIIVEGKYDKIKLSSIVDGLIIETNGFRIFKNKKKMDMIKNLAQNKGILILTDSDSAGFMIRNYISGSVDNNKIKQAYIPDLYGKEKRKPKYSKEGKLGVEGVSEDILIEAIKRAGATIEGLENKEDRGKENRLITKVDFYKNGLTGKSNSKLNRLKLINYLNLPEHLSVNSLINVLNSILTYKEYNKIMKKLNLK